MKKTTLAIVLATLCLNFSTKAQESVKPPPLKNQAVMGKVISASTGESLPGAVIKIAANKHNIVTNDKGEFVLSLSNGNYSLSVHYLNYITKHVIIHIPLKETLVISLEADDQNLKEVEIVSTGYQDIPKERATGSFTRIDNSIINGSVGINILDRLDGVTSGLLLNRSLPQNLAATNSKVSIRGRSTLFANAEPLLVLDGFPYEGNIDQINPADIESVYVLKDAAAASIWGTRAANGVIVLTSKKGKKNQKLMADVSSTFTILSKPDFYYTPKLSSSDFIELEQYLFSKGFYNSRFNNPYNLVSPAVEIFNKRKNSKITSIDSAEQINNLKTYDIRSGLERYASRKGVYQQYQLNLSGGGENSHYYMSGGYDKNLENALTDDYSRLTVAINNSYSLFNDKINITGGISLVSSNKNSKSDPYLPYTPYDRLVDDDGESLPVVTNSTLRASYLDTVGRGNLLDWYYRPKDEFNSNTLDRRFQFKGSFGVNYKILEGLNLNVNYQYLSDRNNQTRDYSVKSYYARNIINRYSSIVNNSVIRGVPLGGILNRSESSLTSNVFRLQLNYNKTFVDNHEVNAIFGYQGIDNRINSNGLTLYGYDAETMANLNNTLDPNRLYKYYYSSAAAQIQTAPYLLNNINITQSFYTNISYIYKGRYIVSGSTRKDESNLFGVKANQKGIPLWSAGFAWIINKEFFYDVQWLNSLKIRATYGRNGNVDKTISGLLTVLNYGLVNEFGSNYSTIANPPNPLLSWEKVKNLNLGLDFVSKNSRVAGSLDFYKKTAEDLIGNSPIAMQSGVSQFRGNSASVQSKGFDLIINSKNLIGKFQWATTLLLNYNTDKVTSFKIKQTSNANIISDNFTNPLEGYPYYAIFSFPSAGLNAIGAPQGYLNGIISDDYGRITSILDISQLKFHGSASPNYFGSFINTLSYKNLVLSLNITYKFDYYFRRTNIFNGFTSTYVSTAGYSDRWQKSGDELITKIPAFNYPQNRASGGFFQNSEDVVEPADHFRLQDIRLSYQLSNATALKSFFRAASFFIYAKNLGVLWRKNNLNIDPDYGSSTPNPSNYSIGINVNL